MDLAFTNRNSMGQVVHTEMTDLKQIYELFEHSIRYQEKRGYPVWKNYDRNAIIRDIEQKNQYKVVIGTEMAIGFSIGYADKIIWRDRDKGTSVYLHRIVVNPEFKGQRLFGTILEWTISHSKHLGLDSVRMDTWTANPTIIEYYSGFGFKVVENYTTPDTTDLPVHNRNLELTLLEYKIYE